jgi:hypothetical protein
MHVYKYAFTSKEVIGSQSKSVLTRSEPCDATPAELERSRLLRHLAGNKRHKTKIYYTQAARLRSKLASPTTRLLDGHNADKVHKYTSVTTLKDVRAKAK